MAGAMIFRARVHDPAKLLLPDVVLLVMAAVTAGLRIATA